MGDTKTKTIRIQNNGQDLQIKAAGNAEQELKPVDITLKPGVNDVDADAWANAQQHNMTKHHTDTEQWLPDRADPHGQRRVWGKRLVVLDAEKVAADAPAGGKGDGGKKGDGKKGDAPPTP